MTPGDQCGCGFGYVPTNVDACALGISTQDWTVPGGMYVYDTGTHVITPPIPLPPTTQSTVLDVEIEVLSVNELVIDGTLQVIGPRPLAIVAWGNARIAGVVDVSASGMAAGPGAPGVCTQGIDGRGGGSGPFNSGGGGGGAGFGADGGTGDGPAGRSDAGLVAGGENLDPLRGGCNGGTGATGAGSAQGGAGGLGGGGLQISASGTLTIDLGGSVQANATSGRGGRQGQGTIPIYGGGGGGGGSGGAILLEARQLVVKSGATICANGGAGGTGAQGGPLGSNGTSGPAITCTRSRAAGPGDAGDGGAGAMSSGTDSEPWFSTSAGEGGGGAAGRVRLRTIDAPPMFDPGDVSPDPMTM